MKILFVFLFSFALTSAACDKPAPKLKAPPAEVTSVKTPKLKAKKPVLDPKMAKVHEALHAGRKIIAIKEHRKLHRLPLHVGKQAVEIEQTKLGLPSLDTVQNLIWKGKEAKAKAHLRLVFRSLNDQSATLKLQKMKKELGLATEANLAVHIKNGKLREAMLIYHHLHPDVEIPEMYKIVSGKIPNYVKY